MPDVTIKLNLGSFGVEFIGQTEYTEKKVEELIGRYFATARTSTPEAAVTTTAIEQGGKKLSAAEFLRRVGHRNQTDRGLVLGYYLERMTGQPSFTSSE